MARRRLVIFLGLPNETSATPEMDQDYEALRREPKKSTVRLAGIKTAAGVTSRKKALTKQKSTSLAEPEVGPVIDKDLEEFVNLMDEDSDDEDTFTLRYKGSVCNVTQGNNDLPRIVNGYQNNPIKLRSFDKTFTKSNIISWWKNVGFLPMSRNALNDPKVRWELGEGGAPEEATERLNLLMKDYKEGAERLTRMGFNGEVLDLEPSRVQEKVIPEGEEAQIKALIKNKSTNSAGGTYVQNWSTCGE